MTSVSHISHSTRQLACQNWAGMQAIHQPDYNLVRWPRAEDAHIRRFLEALTDRQPELPQLRENLLASEVVDRLAAHLAPFAQGLEEGLEHLLTDVRQLATAFAELAGSPKVKTTFALIQHDMCRLFHTDAIELRLLCTYIGPGTLWVPDQYVNWDKMHESSNEARVRDLSKVQQFAPFEVGILKGAMYESNDGPAILHRSPALSEDDSKRVMLRLDSQFEW